MKTRKQELVSSGQWPVASVKSHGFTLIEVLALTVVILMLAATAVPWFSPSDTRARDAALNFNLNMIRSQIETYKNQHGGVAPRLSLFADQMTKPTSPTGHLTGKNLTRGPYFQGQIPVNPFGGNNMLTSVAKRGHTPKAAVPSRSGWQYDETTGALYPNNPEYY
jgi:type II secretory pathway pseudopilin PulG